MDTEDRADVLGVVLHDRPPLEGVTGDGVLFDEDAVFDRDLFSVPGVATIGAL